MEFVIYALLVLSGFVVGFLYGRSKKSDPAPIVIDQPIKPAKRAYVRKAPVKKKGTKAEEVAKTAAEAGVVTSEDAVVNVSKSVPNGRYVGDNYLQSASHERAE